MSKNTGGPAFPGKKRIYRAGYQTNDFEPVSGMELRDYFAAKALPVAWKAFEDGYYSEEGWESTNYAVAECAYQMADAMLAAREAK